MLKDVVEHIFFDLDHTLWDFDRNSSLAYQKIFKERHIDLDLLEFLEVYAPVNLAYWKLYRNQEIDTLSLRRRRLQDVFIKFDLNFSLDEIDAIADDYISYLPLNGHLIPGTLELLDYLKGNYTLHIITNGFREVQQSKLQTSQLLPYFTTITDSDSVGVKKPNPDIFNYALKQANCKREKSLMVGDNFEADIVGAQNIGMHTLLFNYHQEEVPKSILQVEQLKSIKNYL